MLVTSSGDYGNYWRHCTFAHNHSSDTLSSALYVEDGSMNPNVDIDQRIFNTIFWNGDSSRPDIIVGSGVTAIVQHSNWDGDTTGSTGGFLATANISGDPLFRSPGQKNYRLGNVLGSVSPCYAAASQALVGPDPFDLDGDLDFSEDLPLDYDLSSRSWGGTPDIGAFEITSIVLP